MQPRLPRRRHCALHAAHSCSTTRLQYRIALSPSRKPGSSVIEAHRRHFQEVNKLLSASQTEHKSPTTGWCCCTFSPDTTSRRDPPRAWRTRYNSRSTTCQGAWQRICPWPFSGSRSTVSSLVIECSKGSWITDYLRPFHVLVYQVLYVYCRYGDRYRLGR